MFASRAWVRSLMMMIASSFPVAGLCEAAQDGARYEVRARGSGSPADLALAYFDSAQLPPEVLEEMQLEVQQILGAAGVGVRTVREAEMTGGAVLGPERFRLRIIVVGSHPMRWKLPPNALGARIGRDLPPSAIYVFAPVVLQIVGVQDGVIRLSQRQDVSRALARVAVHEIVHAFAPDHPHDGWGLMGHQQDRQSLTRGRPMLDERSATAFRVGLAAVIATASRLFVAQP